MNERKTTRVYGAVVKAIRKKARRKKPFRIKEVPEAIGHRRMFSLLVKKGELRRLKQGGGKTESIYQLA